MPKQQTPSAVTCIFVLATLILTACSSSGPIGIPATLVLQKPTAAGGDSIKLLGTAGTLPITAVAWTSDGKIMALSDSHSITLSDAHTLQDIRRIETPSWVKSLAFSPDGKWLATGPAGDAYSSASPGSISVWDVATGQLVRSWAADDTGFVTGFQSDGQTLATLGYNVVRLWNVNHGQLIRDFRQPMSSWFIVSPDFKHVFREEAGGAAALWDLKTNTSVPVENFSLNGAAFSPDGRRLALAVDAEIPLSDTIQIWNVASGQIERTLNGPGYSHDLAFSLDGKQLVVGGSNDVVQLWDVETGQLRHTLPGQEYSYQFAFSPDGTRLAVADAADSLRWWDTRTGQLLQTAEALRFTDSIFYGPASFLAEQNDEALRLWDTAAGKLVRTFYTEPLEEVVFTPDDYLLLIKPHATTRWYWDQTAQQLKLQNTLPGSGSSSQNYSPRAISPDGTVLAVINLTATIQLFNTQTGQTLHTLKGYSGTIISLAFSRDSAQLISSARLPEFGSEPHGNGELRVWDVRTGQLLAAHETTPQRARVIAQPSAQTWLLERFRVAGSCPRQRGLQDVALYAAEELLADRSKVSPQWANPLPYFGGLAVSSDGRITAVATQSWGCVVPGPVQVWDTQAGALLATVSLNRDTGKFVFFTDLALNPDGSMLAFGADDGSLTTWDINTGRRLQALSGLTANSKHLIFSPDGQLLISGNQDGQIQVWEVRSGELRQTLSGHTAEVTHLLSGHQGRFLVSGSGDGTARLWDLGEDHLPR
ncbi:putative serine/threonine-protein kinase PkwA [Thermoflexales bacterium]|nr:putative serine/threonine-protein kinase PkwA [Thermoflexales bacterium]